MFGPMNQWQIKPADRYVRDYRRAGKASAVSIPDYLYLVTEHEVNDLRNALLRGELPLDFEAKLDMLARGDLLHRSIEQNCRLFIALLLAAQNGGYRLATKADQDKLLRLLVYVRKDDDAVPDYRQDGFVDDQRQIRVGSVELAGLLHDFKAWRLRHQVPEMWAFSLGTQLASSYKEA